MVDALIMPGLVVQVVDVGVRIVVRSDDQLGEDDGVSADPHQVVEHAVGHPLLLGLHHIKVIDHN